MPKLPDDNSDDAKARRAKMSAETRVEVNHPAPPTEAELAEFRAKHGLPEDATVIMCRRGRK